MYKLVYLMFVLFKTGTLSYVSIVIFNKQISKFSIKSIPFYTNIIIVMYY